jgi:excisionase family DNA binding protein
MKEPGPLTVDLGQLLSTPERAENVSHEELPVLLAELTYLQSVLLRRLIETAAAPTVRLDEPDRLLNMGAVAERLGVPTPYARELGRRGELPTLRIGKYVRVRESALLAWLQQREQALAAGARRVYTPKQRRTLSAAAPEPRLRQTDGVS